MDINRFLFCCLWFTWELVEVIYLKPKSFSGVLLVIGSKVVSAGLSDHLFLCIDSLV